MFKRSIPFLGYALAGLLAGIPLMSCKQSAIFHIISLEVAPVEPLINGMPTNLVKFNNKLHAASKFGGTIYQYDGAWKTLSQQPGGQILDLAVTAGYLYALTGAPPYAGISRYDGTAWAAVNFTPSLGNIQTIYGADDALFIGIMEGSDFSIWGLGDDDSAAPIKSGTKLLTGAAILGTTVYLATAGDGIYAFGIPGVQGPLPIGDSGDPESYKANMAGIIAVGNKIVGVTKNGNLLYGDTGGFTSIAEGVSFTGGLALWENTDTTVKLLLLGIQGGGTSTIHGYRELVLNPDGTLNTSDMGLKIPGADPDHSSINNTDRYNSTLRRNPVMAFFQASDADKTLFAATVKKGLWSYRIRDGEYVWNAEN